MNRALLLSNKGNITENCEELFGLLDKVEGFSDEVFRLLTEMPN